MAPGQHALLSRLKAGFQSVPVRVDFLMLVSESVSESVTARQAKKRAIWRFWIVSSN